MIALVVLIGWEWNVPALKSVLPGFIAMQPWTALSVLFGALALSLATFAGRSVRTLSALLAIGMIVGAGLPALEYLTGSAFGTDAWLFPAAVVSAQTHDYANPGRMSQAAATGLTALGGALLLAPLVTGRAGRTAFSALATTALATAVVALLEYALRLEPMDAMFFRNPLALHAALALGALSIGVLALRPDAGWVRAATEQGSAGWLAAGLLATGALLLVFGGNAAMRAGTIAANASAASVQLERLLSSLKDAESGQRGYLLTDRVTYLEPYEAARTKLPDALADVETSLAAVDEHRPDLRSLKGLITSKLTELAETIEFRQQGRTAEALALVKTNHGEALMEAIRANIERLRQEAAEDADARIERARRIAVIAAACIMALALLAFWALAVAARVRKEASEALVGSEIRQRTLLATLGLGTFMARDLDGTIRYWADGCERLYGWTSAEAVGQSSHVLLRTVFPVPLAEIEANLARTGEWTGDLRHRTRDGLELVVTAHKVLRRDAGKGDAGVVLEALTDVTAQRKAEAALCDNQALLRTVVETAPGLIFAKDRQGRLLLANSAVTAIVGKPWEELAGLTDREFLGDAAQGEAIMATDRQIMEAGQTYVAEEEVSGPNGRTGVWLSTKTPMRDADGQVIGLVGMSFDITERKLVEERLRLMVDELNHRVKNSLATVQGIAVQTLRGTAVTVRQTFEGRLRALAAAHDVLTRESWKEADLHEVIDGVLAPHREAGNDRFEVTGPGLRLQPRVALALSMALHELATNAIKYGALSSGGGKVAIHWTITPDAEPRFRLTWSEAGGPTVAEPGQRGLGTRLIERYLALDIGAAARITFEADGVKCVLDAPLAEVAATTRVIPFPRIGNMRGN